MVAGGYLAGLSSRASLTRVASRLLSYKAEQLRDFSHSQFDVLVELEFADRPEYRAAAATAIQTYAGGLLRTDTEAVIAIDRDDRVALSTGSPEGYATVTAEIRDMILDAPGNWIDVEAADGPRVGVGFVFEPFDWAVFVSEDRRTLYRDAERIAYQNGLILAISLIVVVIAIAVFTGYVSGPLARLSRAMAQITETRDFRATVTVEFHDEVGALAEQFNAMIAQLDRTYSTLQNTARSEADARREVSAREHETILLLARATEFRDELTGEHLARVAALSSLLAKAVEADADVIELIARAAPLHDVGKIGIPDAILLKPGRLTPEEFAEMRRHTTIGWELLHASRSHYLRAGAMIALSHHEKWDGSGYPAGLGGASIPQMGRIVAVVDVFDALISQRPYKQAWSFYDAIDYLIDQRGRHFEPRTVDAFVAEVPAIRALVTGRTAS